MKKLKSFFFLLTIAIAFSACIPTPTLVPTTGITSIPPTATMTTTLPPMMTSTTTSTPLPTATSTPEPVADLHDISTWPVEMQKYFNRESGEWINPTRQYVTDVEFHRFVQEARRNLLTSLGITEANELNKDALMLEYLRWGNENKQILILTPFEIRGWYSDPQNIGVAYSHILPNNSGVEYFEGLFVNTKLQDNNANFQSLYESRINRSFTINLFGQDTNVPRAIYGGVAGDMISLFKLPGISSNDGVGVLVHYVNSDGRHCYMPIATHFGDITVRANDMVYLSAANGNPAQIGSTGRDFIMIGAHTGFLGSGDMQPISINDLINSISSKIILKPDSDSAGLISGMFPWQFGIEGGQAFDFSQGNFLPPTIYPWSEP